MSSPPVLTMQLNTQEPIDHYYMASGKIGFVNVASVVLFEKIAVHRSFHQNFHTVHKRG